MNPLTNVPGAESLPRVSLELALVIVGFWLALVLLTAEALRRFTRLNGEVVRKVVHIGAGNVMILAWWLQLPGWVGIAAAGVAATIALISYRLPILPILNSVDRHSWGTFFYALSIGLLMLLFWPQHPQYAVLGILNMTWGDGFAAIVGQRFGVHPYQVWGMKKSWEGSLTMALISFVVTGLVLTAAQGWLWPLWGVALLVAFVATGLEAFSRLGIDNLTVPLGSALLAAFLAQ